MQSANPLDPMATDVRLQPIPGGWCGAFHAMASPCELLIGGGDASQALALTQLARAEALRIEHKYSRYRADSLLGQWQRARDERPGEPVEVDAETAALLDLAAQCHALSGGLFDITSGVLRQAWRFDGSDRLPAPAEVAHWQARVGWSRLRWERPLLTLAPGMELDFGGIGKEYAVDRVLDELMARCGLPLLVNFGGDLAVSGPQADGSPWRVGIERPADATDRPDAPPQAGDLLLELSQGALATSGDARRFLQKEGVRYGHILDPRTGWPVPGAPRSVTVAAGSCTEAGLFSTLAMLQGTGAEDFLCAQGLPHWVLR